VTTLWQLHRGLRARLPAAVLAVVAALVLSGCATSNPSHRQAEAVDDGVQATGIVDGARVAISRGVPEVSFGDCDPGDGLDDDICWVARTIDGLSIAFVIENPAVLVEGATLDVVSPECTGCDEVADGVVVELRVAGEVRRPDSGTVTVNEVPGERAAADFDLSFADGDELRGSFNVRELRPEEL
jgi:hypothetical protein